MPEREDIAAWRAVYDWTRVMLSNKALESAIAEFRHGFYVTIRDGRAVIGLHAEPHSMLLAEPVELDIDQVPGYIAALEAEQAQALADIEAERD